MSETRPSPLGPAKHFLITGGTGFIGLALCKALLTRGHRVSVLSRNATTARHRLPMPISVVESLENVDAIDVVVNLAGAGLADRRWTESRKAEILSSRVNVTRSVVAWLSRCQHKPELMISASAIGWYGPRADEVLDESSAPGHDFAANVCRAWEHEASLAKTCGVRLVLARFGVVLGRDGGALRRMLPAFRAFAGGPISDGRQWMSWVHLDDCLRFLVWAAENEHAVGVYNCTAPSPVTNSEFARTLAAQLHRPSALRVPAWALKLLLGEMAVLLITGQRVEPRRLMSDGFAFAHPTLRDALRNI